MATSQNMPLQRETTESQIASVLQHRYGDGMVYIPGHKPKALFSLAMERGFIDSEGYITRKGRALMARFKYL